MACRKSNGSSISITRNAASASTNPTMTIAKLFKFDYLWHNQQWLSPAYVGLHSDGHILSISETAPTSALAAEYVAGIAVPGFQNAHSHVFQYAMAGLAETHPAGVQDDFWTWREAMYQCALSVDPDSLQAIATMLYTEMLRHGYTHVAEFHYLHHDKNGKPYAHLAELGLRHLEAAKTSGIGITLIPVFYQQGGFNTAPQPRQKRFISRTCEDYLKLLDATKESVSHYSNARLGYSVHSLRAVKTEDIKETYNTIANRYPFHIHVAEQLKEVEDCLHSTNQRPVSWLLNNLPVNRNFHLVHATHLNDDEVKGIAKTKANVVLCPSTEGNLGDGIFRMRDYLAQNGNWSIGTDSHIGLNPLAEFRMIDYRQRLLSHLRNTFDGDGAEQMYTTALLNGRAAMGLPTEPLAVKEPFNVVVYNRNSPLLQCTGKEKLWPTLVYATDASHLAGTIVKGTWVVKEQKHVYQGSILHNFKQAILSIKNRGI
ncbi:MAG: formimidoylglutamate deiminase [Chryseotalea sp.]